VLPLSRLRVLPGASGFDPSKDRFQYYQDHTPQFRIPGQERYLADNKIRYTIPRLIWEPGRGRSDIDMFTHDAKHRPFQLPKPVNGLPDFRDGVVLIMQKDDSRLKSHFLDHQYFTIPVTSCHPEMALFPLSGVLRGFCACDVGKVRLGINPCAALLREKIAHL